MKKIIALFGICAFISLSVFGFLAMNPRGSNMAGCIAEALGSGQACSAATPIEVGIYHVGTFKSLSTLIVAALFALSAVALLALLPVELLMQAQIAYVNGYNDRVIEEISIRRFRRWASRKILSPCM